LRDLMLYLSFKFVRKFKFCVSPLVKRYPVNKYVCLHFRISLYFSENKIFWWFDCYCL